MITLLAGGALIALLWWFSRTLAGSDPARRVRWMKRAGGVLAAAAALVLLLRGRLDVALLLGALAGSLLYAGASGPAFLQTYLYRRSSGRREHVERDAHARRVQPPPAMTEEQAYQILGLAPGADAEAVVASHRRLMKRVHPDGGGSAELAAQVNQARDVLLSRHR